ncbi:hypothetical protein [Rhodococcus koreensis]
MSVNTFQIKEMLELAGSLDQRFKYNPEFLTGWQDILSPYDFDLPQLKEAVRRHYREQTRTIGPSDIIARAQEQKRFSERRSRGNVDCQFCDDEGWVLDPGDKYGWAVKCTHVLGQRIEVKPGHVPAGTPVPKTPEEIQASLAEYWATVHNYSERHRKRTPTQSAPDYDPDAWG